jgi:hypothetical protein
MVEYSNRDSGARPNGNRAKVKPPKAPGLHGLTGIRLSAMYRLARHRLKCRTVINIAGWLFVLCHLLSWRYRKIGCDVYHIRDWCHRAKIEIDLDEAMPTLHRVDAFLKANPDFPGLSLETVGEKLELTTAERDHPEVNFRAAYPIDEAPEDICARKAAKKRKADRERDTANRRRAGASAQSERQRTKDAEREAAAAGVSLATIYRRRKRAKDPSRHSDNDTAKDSSHHSVHDANDPSRYRQHNREKDSSRHSRENVRKIPRGRLLDNIREQIFAQRPLGPGPDAAQVASASSATETPRTGRKKGRAKG